MEDEINDCIRAARTELAVALQFLRDEIRTYPSPIAGCDAQFNHLLAQRQKVLQALNSIDGEVFIPTPRTPTPMAGVESR